MIRIVEVKDKIDKKFYNDWKKLWLNSSYQHPCNSPDWLYVCRDTFGYSKFFVVVAEDNDQLIAVFPLVIEKKFGIKTFLAPGGKYLDRSTLLIKNRSEYIIEDIFNFLKKKGNFYLTEIPYNVVYKIQELNFNFKITKSSECPYIVIKNDPFRFLDKKDKNKIYNRILNNLENLNYQYDVSHFSNDKILSILKEIDDRSSKRKKGQAVFYTKEDILFVKSLIKYLPENISIDIISYKNVPIIFSIGFIYQKVYQACLTAYDDSYKYFQPGKTLLYFLFNRLRKEGFIKFDFSRGVNKFKKEFTPLSYFQYNVYHAQFKFIKDIWTIIHFTQQAILKNKFLYSSYCSLKKYRSYILK